MLTVVPGLQARADVGDDRVEDPPSPGAASASTSSGGTAITRSGPSATAAVVSVTARSAPAADDRGEDLVEVAPRRGTARGPR